LIKYQAGRNNNEEEHQPLQDTELKLRERSVNKIFIIIAPLTIVSEHQWGDFECLYKARQAAITDGGLFTDELVKMNDRVKMTVR